MGEILVPIQEYKKLIQTELRYKQVQEALYKNTEGRFSTWQDDFQPYLNLEAHDFFDVYKVIDSEFYEVLLEDKYVEARKKYEAEKDKEEGEENVSE